MKPLLAPEDVPYALVETIAYDVVRHRTSPSGEFRLLKRAWRKDPKSGKMYIGHSFWDGAPGDFRSREEARLWCECAGIDFDREVLENDG